MKRNPGIKKALLSVLLCCWMAAGCALSASANSAPAFWAGKDSTGVLLRGDSCPIEVKSEKLTLRVTDLPEPYQDDTSFWASYSNEMTAEYTFFNPTKEAVSATVVFPCGTLPDYAWTRGGEKPDHTARYGAFVNGQPVETTVRYSLDDGFDAFHLAPMLARLRDDVAADAFLKPDTTVTTYVCRFDGIALQDRYDAEAVLRIAGGTAGRYLCVGGDGYNYVDICSDMAPCSIWIEDGFRECTMTVFGPPLGEGSEWEVSDPSGNAIGKVAVPVGKSVTMTDYCRRAKATYPDASDTDLFNAYADALHSEYLADTVLTEDGYFIPGLMRWYEYGLTLQPAETLVNSVCAPLYPVIRGNRSPRLYDFTYLLSPAAEWADFGALEVAIETPYYLSDVSPEGFRKTDNGFLLQTEGLPEGELTFTLCESRLYLSSAQSMILSVLFSLFLTGIFLGIVRMVRAVGKRFRKTVPYRFSGMIKPAAEEDGVLFREVVHVTDQDYYEFNRFVSFSTASGKRTVTRLRVLIAVTCLLCLFSVYLNDVSMSSFSDLTLLVAVAIPLMMIPQALLKPFLLWSLKRRLKGLRRHGRLLYTPEAVLTFEESRFREITPLSKSELDYAAIERICVVRDRVIYLFKENTMAYLIPIHAFSSQAEWNDLLAFLEKRTGKSVEWFPFQN
ncbi:MAG: YcxB family protein [Clostridia bacterium]|nr:YcxB family protein [Clostridia bacterium]